MSYLLYLDNESMIVYARFPFGTNGTATVEAIKQRIPSPFRRYVPASGRSWSVSFGWRGPLIQTLDEYKGDPVWSEGPGKPSEEWFNAEPSGLGGPGRSDGRPWWATITTETMDGPPNPEFVEQDDKGWFKWEYQEDATGARILRRKRYDNGDVTAWMFYEDQKTKQRKQKEEEEKNQRKQQQQNSYGGSYGYDRGGRPGGNRRSYDPPPPPPPRSSNGHDPYSTLFVTRNAPKEVIAAAYKALSRTYHPDKGGSEEKMKALNVAYDQIKG